MDELVDAIQSGDKRAQLEAIRDRLAGELVKAKGNAAAAVAKELRATLEALDSIPGGEVSAVDDLTAKRQARRASATGG